MGKFEVQLRVIYYSSLILNDILLIFVTIGILAPPSIAWFGRAHQSYRQFKTSLQEEWVMAGWMGRQEPCRGCTTMHTGAGMGTGFQQSRCP